MKTQEEIEQLAELYTQDGIYLSESEKQQTEIAYMTGYTQCQEDMVEKYTEQDMIKFAFDTYYQEDMAKKYTEEDMIDAIIYGSSLTTSNVKLYAHNYINSLNKQD
jgi:hypothetical protein